MENDYEGNDEGDGDEWMELLKNAYTEPELRSLMDLDENDSVHRMSTVGLPDLKLSCRQDGRNIQLMEYE